MEEAGEEPLFCERAAGIDIGKQSLPVEPRSLPLAQIAQRVIALGLAFATVDLALRADGTWRVVEVGDGQVSGLPATTAAADLIAALWPR